MPSFKASFGAPKRCNPAGRCAVRVRAEAPAPGGIETTGPNMTALKDVQEIMDILPHR
jgi:hypothetical protein